MHIYYAILPDCLAGHHPLQYLKKHLRIYFADVFDQSQNSPLVELMQSPEYMGVSQAMISKWESGEYNFTINTLTGT